MLVKVKPNEFQILRELEVETYVDTFGPYISDADMEDYYQTVLSLEQIQKDLADPESETYFVLDHHQEICGFLKFNWGKAQTEPVEMDNAFEIQRIYVALKEAQKRGFDWAWLGVWERNYKAQNFYKQFGFERFSEHHFITGETVDTDWLLRKHLKENPQA